MNAASKSGSRADHRTQRPRHPFTLEEILAAKRQKRRRRKQLWPQRAPEGQSRPQQQPVTDEQ